MVTQSKTNSTPSIGLHVEPDERGGFVVRKVDRFGSADKAGIKVGDRILAFNDIAGPTQASFQKVAQDVGVGNTLLVKLLRDDKPLELPMKLLAKKASVSLEISSIEEILERKISP